MKEVNLIDLAKELKGLDQVKQDLVYAYAINENEIHEIEYMKKNQSTSEVFYVLDKNGI